MYFEEKIVGKWLCYRSKPNGNWIPYTKDALRDRYLGMQKEADRLRDLLNEANAKLREAGLC